MADVVVVDRTGSGLPILMKDVGGGNLAPYSGLIDGAGLSPQMTQAGDSIGNRIGLTVFAILGAVTGTNIHDQIRAVNVIKKVQAVAVTAGTPVSIWTPTSGKKFRLMAWLLSLSVAGKILFEDATGGGNEFARTALMAAGVGVASPPLGNGFLSAVANNQLFIDVSATGSVDGFVAGVEE